MHIVAAYVAISEDVALAFAAVVLTACLAGPLSGLLHRIDGWGLLQVSGDIDNPMLSRSLLLIMSLVLRGGI